MRSTKAARRRSGSLNELMEEDRLRVSTQVLQELFVTLTRKVRQRCSSEEALGVLEDLAAWPLMVVDYAAIRAAVKLVYRRLEPWAGNSGRPSRIRSQRDRLLEFE
jgi:predicted nucleic acid-binding protein